ncbi:hypothetical protein PUNSTDRAFT_129217 [Punctularia strigosozonata HHB-11173 SS5]|uniref:uncharacterized protein n=1 Tax=Punctularia strigosozonata (strain HHB-11173) TaxID=741275 RepID=UPI000441856F|nr:uncharacterized protein PUNSTDRAFT_129217 [Punctularia strigosozonata HHB-11173 SS5]EIN14759.1 hypothetical protein PUNSTDRAFT_129217 [Punctularia strigosozonata HHB-11173 SS5]
MASPACAVPPVASTSTSDPTAELTEQVASLSVEDEEARIRACLKDAEGLKQQGNDYFKAGKWNEALAAYQSALGRLPKRPVKEEERGKGKGREVDDEPKLDQEPQEDANAEGGTDVKQDQEEEPEPEPTELEKECAKARAVMNANVGACHVKLNEYKEAVAACTEAIADDPLYIKAIQRRAASNEQIGNWSALAAAQEDYDRLLALLPASSAQAREVQYKLRTLKPRVEAAQKREMAEMWDKLKGVGNSILGNFGLSTDNFKFEPNGQGGYSMNFVR